MTGPLLERVRANSLTLGDQPALTAGADVILVATYCVTYSRLRRQSAQN